MNLSGPGRGRSALNVGGYHLISQGHGKSKYRSWDGLGLPAFLWVPGLKLAALQGPSDRVSLVLRLY